MTPGRGLSAAGALAALCSLGLTWLLNVTPTAQVPLDGVDLGRGQAAVLAVLALVGLLAAVVRRIPLDAAVRVACALSIAVLAVRELVDQQGRPDVHLIAGGGWAALTGAAALAAGAALDARRVTDGARVVRWAVVIAPLAFLAPVGGSFLTTLWALLNTPEVDLGGWANTVVADARAVYVGEPLYQDPAKGHVGQLYTPLQNVIAGFLHHVWFWSGWLSVLSALGSFIPAVCVAVVAHRPDGRDRAVAWLEAAAFGAVAWWMMATLAWDMSFSGHVDQLAWGFAILGVVLMPGVVAGRRAATVGAMAAFTAAFWTKQPTIVVPFAAVVFLGLMALRGRFAWRAVALFAGVLFVLNAGIAGVMALLTDGWSFYFNFLMTMERPHSPLYVSSKSGWLESIWVESRAAMLVPVALTLALCAIAAWVLRRRPRLDTPPVQVALIALLVLPLTYGLYMSARRQDGTFDNHLIGAMWCLALIGAAAYRLAGARTAGRLACAGVIAFAWLLTQWPAGREPVESLGARVQPLRTGIAWLEVPPDMREYARDHLVWHPEFAGLNAERQGVIHTTQIGMGDLLSMGTPPGALEDALLTQRFDAAGPILVAPPNSENPYFSGNGRYEENYFIKLKAMIEAKYNGGDALANGRLWRRRVPDAAPWMNACFGPFSVAGAEWRINKGGGFWCHEAATLLHLRQTFADYSDVRTDETVRATGTVELSANRTGFAMLAFEREDGSDRISVHLSADGDDATKVELRRDDRPISSVVVPASRTRLRARVELASGEPAIAQIPGGVRLSVPAGARVMRYGATRDSDARIDLRAARLSAAG